MKLSRVSALYLLSVSVLATLAGCELIANPDRSLIPGSGGSSSGTGGATTTSTTSASTGGMGGTGGTTSSTGGGMPCLAPSDCPDPGNECVDRTCDASLCGTKPKAAGTVTAAQTTGDCKQKQCDGAGNVVDANLDTDLPVDGLECTDDVCTAGVASNPFKAINTTCGAGGALKCDGAGACVGCTTAVDCGQDTECQTRTCSGGACGVVNALQGKMVTAQVTGDCQVAQCDGAGAVETVPDNADLPVDGETCTQDLCTAGVPSNPPLAAGTACAEGTGTQCDGAGKCAECLVANDCPGQDTECQKRACTMGACGVTFTAMGTALGTQAAGDCKKAVCDGAGGTTSQNDDTDLPNDNNVCTTDVCTAGVPSHANAPDGARAAPTGPA
jgi:hypothetical protein